MITPLRKSIKGFYFKIFLVVVGLLMVFGVGITFLLERGKHGGSWIAIVNGRNVPMDSFGQAVAQEQLRIRQLRQQLGQYADMLLGSMNPAQMAVERLVTEELISEVADALGIHIDPEVIVQQIVKILPRSAFDETGRIDQAMLARILPHYKNIHAFEDAFEQGLRRDLVMHIVRQSQYVPDFVIKQQFADEYLKRKYSVLVFPLSTYIAKEKSKTYSDKELTVFFDEQNMVRNAYVIPAKRAGSVWEFSPKNYGISVEKKALKDYYNKYKRTKFLKKAVEFTVRRISFSMEKDPLSTYEQAQKVIEAIKKDPKQFEALARAHSDHETASKGGLFTFQKGTQDPMLETAVMRLKADEEISSLVKAGTTLEIVQRIKRVPAQYEPFDRAKSQIESRLIEQKFTRAFKNDARGVVAKGSQSVTDFIQSKKGKKSPIALQEKADTEQSKTIFRLKKNDYGFYIEGDKGFIVLATEIKPQHTLKLVDIKEQVRADMQKDRAKKVVAAVLKEAKLLVAQKGLKAVQEKYGAQLITTGFIKRGQLHEEGHLKREQVPVARMAGMNIAGSTQDALHDTAGYIMQLTQIEPFDQKLYEQHKADLAEQLALQNRTTYETGFIASLRRNATIERNTQLIAREK